MNKDLEKVLRLYSVASHSEFIGEMVNYSKDNLISIFSDLLTIYINDKNSSTIREFLTCSIAGYKHNARKIGFNGFKLNSIGEIIGAEVKPQNFSIHDLSDFENGQRTTKPKKLSVSGNFTDYTWDRFFRNQKQNLNMLFSGFIDGKLIYILELPYDDKLFLTKLETGLKKRFPDGDIVGEYLRSANFSFKDFKESENLKIVFCLSKFELNNFKKYMSADLFNYLYNRGA